MTDACYRAAFVASPDAILVLRPTGDEDLDPEIVAANPAAGVLIGLAAEALVGRRLCDVLPSASMRTVRLALAQAVAEGRSGTHEAGWDARGSLAHMQARARRTAGRLVLYLAEAGELRRARLEIERQRREFAKASKVMATHAAHLAEAAAAAEDARTALVEEIALREELQRELQRMAVTDALTGVLNRRGFAIEGGRLIASAQREGTPLASILVDADHFKLVNDLHGHGAGDAALVRLAGLLAEETRPAIDVIGRIGGEEFAALLPRVETRQAVRLAERLRERLETGRIEELRGSPLTASFGVAALAPGQDLAGLLRQADEALYRAKRGGRNRVECADVTAAAA